MPLSPFKNNTRKSKGLFTDRFSRNLEQDLDLKDLGQYYGTEGYTQGYLGVKYTDGVVYVANNGYSWFITDASTILKMENKVKNEDFVVVKLIVSGNKAEVRYEDGNGKLLYVQKYASTNARKNLILYYQNGVLLLSGEY